MAVRYVNIIAGVWLFVSAFLWQHSPPSRMNNWIVGALIMLFAAIGLLVPVARILNTMLSIWLFFSALAVFHLMGATLWNNLLVATIVFIASLVPTTHAAGRRHRPRKHAEA